MCSPGSRESSGRAKALIWRAFFSHASVAARRPARRWTTSPSAGRRPVYLSEADGVRLKVIATLAS